MCNRMMKIAYAIFIALLTVALVVFMVMHVTKGLAGGNEKLILCAYILMIAWALMKLHGAIKALRDTDK